MLVFQISRHKLLFCMLPVLLLISLVGSYTITTTDPLSGKIIIVDAGHGGIDSGANRPGILEKDLNLAVAVQLKDVLSSYGANVILSREIDTELSGQCDNDRVKGRYRRDLAARLEMVQESGADLFISIHSNASPNPKRRGADTFYYVQSETSKILATFIQSELSLVTPAASKAAPGDYFVLRHNTIPAVLIEIGYITHPDERQLLQSPEHHHKLAKAIVKGIRSYYQDH